MFRVKPKSHPPPYIALKKNDNIVRNTWYAIFRPLGRWPVTTEAWVWS